MPRANFIGRAYCHQRIKRLLLLAPPQGKSEWAHTLLAMLSLGEPLGGDYRTTEFGKAGDNGDWLERYANSDPLPHTHVVVHINDSLTSKYILQARPAGAGEAPWTLETGGNQLFLVLRKWKREGHERTRHYLNAYGNPKTRERATRRSGDGTYGQHSKRGTAEDDMIQ